MLPHMFNRLGSIMCDRSGPLRLVATDPACAKARLDLCSAVRSRIPNEIHANRE
jgi:hypothetical protein